MAKPRVFVSSTHYDLKYIRASLDLFIDSLGFESILSEKGDVPYTNDIPPHESCYREAEQSDIFVLLVGGRYGSEAIRSSDTRIKRHFNDRYDSITSNEFGSAAARGIPIYILIESKVLTEYQTFQLNKDRTDISYAHVDSINIFLLIESILEMPINNPCYAFERYEDIEKWLRDQWAGLFKELLRKQSEQQQLSSLTTEVAQLKEQNNTLKTYIEALMRKKNKDEYESLIKSEEKRLEQVFLKQNPNESQNERLSYSKWIETVSAECGKDFDEIIKATRDAKDLTEYLSTVASTTKQYQFLMGMLLANPGAKRDLDETRDILEVSRFQYPEQPNKASENEPLSTSSIDIKEVPAFPSADHDSYDDRYEDEKQ
jgi:hypothetical protein